MRNQRLALLVLGIFCIVVSLMHAARVVFKGQLAMFGFYEPDWYSALSITLPLLLAVWVFGILLKKPSRRR